MEALEGQNYWDWYESGETRKTYSGKYGDPCRINVGYELSPRLDLRPNSPGGMTWGYSGTGPNQLAFAILFDHTGDPEFANSRCRDFNIQVLSRFEKESDFELTGEEVQRWVDDNNVAVPV